MALRSIRMVLLINTYTQVRSITVKQYMLYSVRNYCKNVNNVVFANIKLYKLSTENSNLIVDTSDTVTTLRTYC